ncbi:MAG: biotin transporter BioY, partial [Clostridia bacterium]|nr:biotin transporter BioY [Clostridia bacterium]
GAFVMGLLAGETQKDLKFGKALVSALAGLAIIYCCGVIQLSLVAGLSIGQAILVGVLPYLPLEAVKILLAAKIVSSVRRRGVLNI